MNIYQSTKRLRPVMVMAVLLLTAGFVAGDASSATAKTMTDKTPNMRMMSGDMMESCKAMGKKHEHMATKMAKLDERLVELVEKMNAARGASRTEAIATVISELVTQHSIMWRRHAELQAETRSHVMSHLRAGMEKDMAAEFTMCPMMKDAAQENAASNAGDHAAHH